MAARNISNPCRPAATPGEHPTEWPKEPVKPVGPKPGDEPHVPKPS